MNATKARDILVKQYIKFVGEAPLGGGWMLSQESLDRLPEMEPYFGPAEKFLADQMTAFLLRSEAALGKHPRSHFFAESYLFADSSLEYLGKHRDNLNFIQNSVSSFETFGGMVQAEIFAGETQYLEGALSYGPPDFEMMRPSVWWMLACVSWQRFKFADIPDYWLEGTSPCISAMLRPKPKQEVLVYERNRLKTNKHLAEIVDAVGRIAVEEATYGWLQQHRLGVVIRQDYHWEIVGAPQDFIDKVSKLVPVLKPMAERDRRLRAVVCRYAESLGMEVCKEVRESSGDSDGKKPDLTGCSINFDDLMAGFVASSTGLDSTADD